MPDPENPLRREENGVFVNAAGERFIEVRDGVYIAEEKPPTEEELQEYYARFERPHFSPRRILLQVLIPLAAASALAAGMYFLLRRYGWGLGACIGIVAGVLGAYMLLRLKSILIFCIRCYQRFAPMSVRERCHLTPTCSAYMIAALEKYGLFRGLRKGFGRLYRCRGQYGTDEP